MDLSVVVTTLNDRDRLVACLDALAEHASTAEVIVVNGPSADGTTGTIRAREDVAELVEIAERNVNVARNAGLSAATGDVVALVANYCRLTADWLSSLEESLASGTDVVTGPIRTDGTHRSVETRTIAGRTVTYFNGGNVAFRRSVLDELDGFDEYLQTGGARDAAHRLADMDWTVNWLPEFAVDRDEELDEKPGEHDWGAKYRSLAYRLVKNYGPRPTVFRRTASHAGADALIGGRQVVSGEVVPSCWVGNGRDVIVNGAVGAKDGFRARFADRTPSRNPNGLSSRSDRAVERYDFR